MKIGFLITARLKSSRLNLKLLLQLNGCTVIERIIQRAKAVIECDDIVLCTSNSNQDLPLVRIAKENDIYYFNGHPDDVLQRLLDASLLFNLDYFIGITADNPLYSIYHANLLVDTVQQNPSLDFVYTDGMPIGVNIYAMNVKALKTVCAIKEQVDTEIWGYLIKRPEIFNVREIKAAQEFIRNTYRLTLDEFDDYRLFKALYNKFPKDAVIDVLDAYDVLDSNSDIARINTHVVQCDLGEDVKRAINNYYKKNRKHILKMKEEIYAIKR
ncbi:cytidylyltransferase domain-containing protein [Thermodesulfobacteriota bacterium]